MGATTPLPAGSSQQGVCCKRMVTPRPIESGTALLAGSMRSCQRSTPRESLAGSHTTPSTRRPVQTHARCLGTVMETGALAAAGRTRTGFCPGTHTPAGRCVLASNTRRLPGEPPAEDRALSEHGRVTNAEDGDGDGSGMDGADVPANCGSTATAGGDDGAAPLVSQISVSASAPETSETTVISL